MNPKEYKIMYQKKKRGISIYADDESFNKDFPKD